MEGGRSSREAMEGSRTAAVDVEALTSEADGRAGAGRGEALWPGRIAAGGDGGVLGNRVVPAGTARVAASSWTPSRPVNLAGSRLEAAACRESLAAAGRMVIRVGWVDSNGD
jgi:hypothetical protein